MREAKRGLSRGRLEVSMGCQGDLSENRRRGRNKQCRYLRKSILSHAKALR